MILVSGALASGTPSEPRDRTGETVTVLTSNGPVLGQTVLSIDPRMDQPIEYTAFHGIPFATPPLGDLRFRPPQPVAGNWSEPLDGTLLDNRICYQLGGLQSFLGYNQNETEDCLYLNVYSPKVQTTEKMPVMLWATGGGFLVGGQHWYGPDFFMAHEVILVVANYRLGPLGFLTLGTKEAPGNAGLLDQIAALEWIQENIGNFGGDKNRVTMAGESAGSFSSFYHLASPKSRGLFQRLIGQSGMAGLSPAYHQYSPQQAVRYAHTLAIEVGCLQFAVPDILECLRNESNFWLSLVNFAVQPVIDGEITDDPYMPESPEVVFKNGNYDKSVDILLGANQDEGLLVTQLFLGLPSLFPLFYQMPDIFGPRLLFMLKEAEIVDYDRDLAKEIILHYTGAATLEDLTIDNLNQITEMYTDAAFFFGNNRFVELHRGHAEGTLYQYMNKYINDGFQVIWAPGLDSLPGVSHSAELTLEFSPYIGMENKNLTARDAAASLFITTAFTNFMKTGDPGLGWDPITQSDWKYMSIQEEPAMEMEATYLDRMEFWHYVISKFSNRDQFSNSTVL